MSEDTLVVVLNLKIEALKRERDELKHDIERWIEINAKLATEVGAMEAVVDAAREWREEDEMDDTKAVRVLLAAFGRLDRKPSDGD